MCTYTECSAKSWQNVRRKAWKKSSEAKKEKKRKKEKKKKIERNCCAIYYIHLSRNLRYERNPNQRVTAVPASSMQLNENYSCLSREWCRITLFRILFLVVSSTTRLWIWLLSCMIFCTLLVHLHNKQGRQCMYNTETRWCNHFCNGRAMSITYSECVFLALGIQHAKRMRCVLLSSVVCPAVQYFYT